MPRVAIIQRPPTLLSRSQTLRDAVSAVREAAAGGARLIVFPEAFIPGYPAWIWRLRPGGDAALSERLYSELLSNAVRLDGENLAPLCAAAKEYEVTLVCGLNELDADYSRGTVYNTAVVIGPAGDLLNRHRKLMPTNPERMVWGFGDGTGLRVVETPCGRVGTLICWENYMPLARLALYAQGVEIYIAPTYDCGDRWIATLRHIAREGGCWVLGSGIAFRGCDIPDAVPGKSELYPDPEEWVNEGDSVVVAPGGEITAGPMRRELGILYADVEPERCGLARRTLDVVGHYARPDVFHFQVRQGPLRPASFEDSESARG